MPSGKSHWAKDQSEIFKKIFLCFELFIFAFNSGKNWIFYAFLITFQPTVWLSYLAIKSWQSGSFSTLPRGCPACKSRLEKLSSELSSNRLENLPSILRPHIWTSNFAFLMARIPVAFLCEMLESNFVTRRKYSISAEKTLFKRSDRNFSILHPAPYSREQSK